ncbi:hypothetical protein [Pedobacter paludis]|uniref:TerB family tellurite resistance protein n=1 Tax=Pedobacter paludis TaxID=2203212 RepID=A0A317F2B7_9SPHI|nr:hypothetical protein [Pedobacter paludis]PWS32187.1 hypothetical protein DF947_10480 [Pedobacter paludis]
MKKKIIIAMVFLASLCHCAPASAQSLANLLIKLGLNVEKLAQFKSNLTEIKNGIKVLTKGYNAVKDVTQGNFSLHKVFLDGLMEVSPSVKKYYKIPKIIENQIFLVEEYKNANRKFRSWDSFTVEELSYIASVYNNLFDESLQNLDELITVTTAGKLRMSDDERLKTIDRIDADMQDKLDFLRSFNQRASLLAVERVKEKREIESAKRLRGIEKQ